MVGRGDGYVGHWDPDHSVAGSGEFRRSWPLKPQEGRATLFTLGRDEAGFIWTCRECGWFTRTLKYERPKHPICTGPPKDMEVQA